MVFLDGGVKLVTLNGDDNVIKESVGPFSTKKRLTQKGLIHRANG